MKHISEVKGGCPPVEYRENPSESQIIIVAVTAVSTVGRLVATDEGKGVWLLGGIKSSDSAPFVLRHWLSRIFKDSGRLYNSVSFRGVGIGSEMMERFQAWCIRTGVVEVYGSVVDTDLAATPKLLDWYRRRGFEIAEPEPRCMHGAVKQVIWFPNGRNIDESTGAR